MKIFEIDDEAAHAIALYDTGFWGNKGAGAIIGAKDTGRLLLGLRSEFVQEPNTWGTWGGAIDSNENIEHAVKREIREETGYIGTTALLPLYVFSKSDFKYFNFLAIVDNEFTPTLNWENSNFGWFDLHDLPVPLHFGLQGILNDTLSLKKIESFKKYSKNRSQKLISDLK